MSVKENTDSRLIIPLKEAARMLCMCRQTLMDHVHRGNLPCVRFGRNSVHFKLEDLQDFIDENIQIFNPTRIPC